MMMESAVFSTGMGSQQVENSGKKRIFTFLKYYGAAAISLRSSPFSATDAACGPGYPRV